MTRACSACDKSFEFGPVISVKVIGQPGEHSRDKSNLKMDAAGHIQLNVQVEDDPDADYLCNETCLTLLRKHERELWDAADSGILDVLIASEEFKRSRGRGNEN